MKTKMIDKTGKEKETNLPEMFNSEIRKDILAKVFESQKLKQPMGVMYGAGAFYSASGISKKARHKWKGTYGKGISRSPRKIMSRSGASFNWVGATAPNTRGGRRAHPPKAEENQYRKINKKELVKAFFSALSGTVNENAIERKYGIKIQSGLVLDKDILALKSKEFVILMKKVFGENIDKVFKVKKQRAGKGKLRGRKYKSNRGMLFVIASDETMKQGGVDIVRATEIRISDLAPNGEPGRITAYTEKAIKEIETRFGEKNEK